MSHYDYEKARELMEQDLPFASLIMAAYRRADPFNSAALYVVFQEIIDEFLARYDAPGGWLVEEQEFARARQILSDAIQEAFDNPTREQYVRENEIVHVIVGPHEMLCGASAGIAVNMPFTADVDCPECLQALETGCHVG